MQKLEIHFSKSSSAKFNSTLVVLAQGGKNSKNPPKVSTSDNDVKDLVRAAASENAFHGKANETLFFRNAELENHSHLLLVGLDEKTSAEALRVAGATAFKALKKEKVLAADFDAESITKPLRSSVEALDYFSQGLLLANYSYDDYKGKAEKNKKQEKTFSQAQLLLTSKQTPALVKKAVNRAEALTSSINFTRWLGDTPGNLMTPDILAKETVKAAKGTKLKVTVWDKARIKKEGFGGLYGVSLGSDFDPRFIVIEYKGAAASKKPICFVGKGLTFDCGGVSLKPPGNMHEMKYDMCGGAAVIGALLAIARLGLKVNAVAYVPSSENVINGKANKPGDILTARDGKTVEVLNTDAEGRLILMDALAYASEQKPAAIIDVATLTGAILVSLHNLYTGVFTRDNKLMGKIEKAATKAGEDIWRMPLSDHHSRAMKGLHADLQNISNHRGGGSSTAAAFLEYFVDPEIPWAHFDIAGTSTDTKHLKYCPEKGASGVMVRTFVELAQIY